MSQCSDGLVRAGARPMPPDQGKPATVSPGRRQGVATARLAGWEGGAARPSHSTSVIGGCGARTRYMSAVRGELHHLADLRPAPGLVRAHASGAHGPETDLPFSASSDPALPVPPNRSA